MSIAYTSARLLRPVERVRALLLPAARPLLLEPVQGRTLGETGALSRRIRHGSMLRAAGAPGRAGHRQSGDSRPTDRRRAGQAAGRWLRSVASGRRSIRARFSVTMQRVAPLVVQGGVPAAAGSTSAAGGPSSTTRPPSTTSTRSAISTVDSRCAMTIAVRSAQDRAQRPLHQPLARACPATTSPRRGSARPGRRGTPGRTRRAAAARRRAGRRAGGRRCRTRRAGRAMNVVRPDRLGAPRSTSASAAPGRPNADVVGDGAGEEVVLLGDHHDRPAQVGVGERRAGRPRRA